MQLASVPHSNAAWRGGIPSIYSLRCDRPAEHRPSTLASPWPPPWPPGATISKSPQRDAHAPIAAATHSTAICIEIGHGALRRRHTPLVARALVHDVRPARDGVARQLLAAERAARVVSRRAERRLVLEGLRLVALGDQVLGERRHLHHLATLLARHEHRALLPEVEVQLLLVKRRVVPAAELARVLVPVRVAGRRRELLRWTTRRRRRRPCRPAAATGDASRLLLRAA
mmetsp:Transcript_21083/g.56751  ORF Transcript_21083/g.56751 Transcript_21083/m.56751 type:complete len:229 (+) Transcript_21083:135-821(+)